MKAFLILPLVFGALLLVPSFGAVYGGVIVIPISATTTWVGTGDGQSWSDINNWDRQGLVVLDSTIPFNHALPEICDLVIIDDGTSAVTVHFNIPSFQLGNEMQIGADDTLVIDSGTTFNHTPDPFCQPLNLFVETIVNNGNLNVFGTLINNGAFINNGAVLDCGIISGNVLPLPGIVNQCPVGGEMIPVDSTALLLAGTHSTASWMIPVIVSASGIVLLISNKKIRLKNNMCPCCKSETDDSFELGKKLVGKCKNSKCRVSLFFLK